MSNFITDINKLKPHENIIEKNLLKLYKSIKKLNLIKNPIIVEKDNFVILDGHHRYYALKKLGCKKAPVYLVNYFHNEVLVKLRRRLKIKNIKKSVVLRALKSRPFPPKTTKHIIKNRPKNINLKLDELIN